MLNRNVHIDIGINGCFLARRWEDPESWLDITKKIGFSIIEFDSDCLDPFFSGDKNYQLNTAKKVRELADEKGILITDYYTGVATHRFHGLSHSNETVRTSMRKWIVDAMDISIALGAKKIGGHFDAFSVEVLSDEKKYLSQLQKTYDEILRIAEIGKQKGIEALYLEQMYTPSEIPWTLKGADDYLVELNSRIKVVQFI